MCFFLWERVPYCPVPGSEIAQTLTVMGVGVRPAQPRLSPVVTGSAVERLSTWDSIRRAVLGEAC